MYLNKNIKLFVKIDLSRIQLIKIIFSKDKR